MAGFNYCELFRYNGQYCDVFAEDGHYLYAEAEPFGWAHMLTCREYAPTSDGGWIVSAYCGADSAYLANLEPAPDDVARAVIASEERYTLEHMAIGYGYTPKDAVDAYREQIADGNDPHDAFTYVAACMMEHDLL